MPITLVRWRADVALLAVQPVDLSARPRPSSVITHGRMVQRWIMAGMLVVATVKLATQCCFFRQGETRQSVSSCSSRTGCVANFLFQSFSHRDLEQQRWRARCSKAGILMSVILLCGRWYLAYNLSLRNLEEMMAERGISVDHATFIDGLCAIRPNCWSGSIGASEPSPANGMSTRHISRCVGVGRISTGPSTVMATRSSSGSASGVTWPQPSGFSQGAQAPRPAREDRHRRQPDQSGSHPVV